MQNSKNEDKRENSGGTEIGGKQPTLTPTYKRLKQLSLRKVSSKAKRRGQKNKANSRPICSAW